jgi:flagellar protein FlaF
MGFSVSGSAAIIFAGLFIAFGMWHGAASDAFERVSDAQQDETDATLGQQNTAIEITDASGTLTVKVENTGSTTLALDETDVVVDNEYQTGWRSGADVEGDSTTDLWHPGQTLTLDVGVSSPSRVKVTTEYGVADTAVIG